MDLLPVLFDRLDRQTAERSPANRASQELIAEIPQRPACQRIPGEAREHSLVVLDEDQGIDWIPGRRQDSALPGE